MDARRLREVGLVLDREKSTSRGSEEGHWKEEHDAASVRTKRKNLTNNSLEAKMKLYSVWERVGNF